MTIRRSVGGRIDQTWRRLFPERHVMIREHGRMRHFTLRSSHQLLAATLAVAGLCWSALATGGWLSETASTAVKERELTHQLSDMENLRGDYRAAITRLDQFQGMFASITCEIGGMQDSLLKIAQRNLPAGKAPAPRLAADSGCRAAAPQREEAVADTVPAPIPPTDGAMVPGAEREALQARLSVLETELDRLRASHDAFLQLSAGYTALRVDELERTLSRVGVDTKSLARGDAAKAEASRERYGQGGPFVPAPPAGTHLENIGPAALFNTHADRLDSLNAVMQSLPLSSPLEEFEVTSPFGARNDPINSLSGIHEGVDLGAPPGTPVVATGGGKVTWAGWRDRYGNMVEVQHAMGLRTRYAHLQRVLVQLGDTVNRGTPVGLLGDTGRTTGPHLHYEVRVGDDPTNPMKFITAGRDVLKVQ